MDGARKYGPQMDEIYVRAMNNEVMMTNADFYKDVAPLTQRHQYGRGRRRTYDPYELIYGVDNMTIENNRDNLCIQQLERFSKEDFEINNLEINNFTGRFSGGYRKEKNGKSFGGTFKTDNRCFNCGATDHWAADCPRKSKKQTTKAMSRTQRRNRKGKETIEKNQYSKNRSRSHERSNSQW